MASFEIKRRNGEVHTVLVDDADLERVLAAGRWSAEPRGRAPNTRVYARRVEVRNGVQHTVYLHRFILGEDVRGDVDHVNSDGLDNRRENLRIARRSENNWNGRRPGNNTSGLKGISWSKTANRWHVYLAAHGKRTTVGFFDCKLEGFIALNIAREAIHGTFARAS